MGERDPNLSLEGELWREKLSKEFDLDKARNDAFEIFKDQEKFKEWLRITVGFVSIEYVKNGKTPLYYDGLSLLSQVWAKEKEFRKEYEKN